MLTKRNLRETQYYSHINSKINQPKLINTHSKQEFLNHEIAYDRFIDFSYTVVIHGSEPRKAVNALLICITLSQIQ